MTARHQPSFLDGPYARLLAAGVVALVIVALLAIHWEDLFPSEQAAVAGDDPVSQCIAQRTSEIDEMIRQNPEMSSRRETMVARIPPMCEDLAGADTAREGAGGALPLPGQTDQH